MSGTHLLSLSLSHVGIMLKDQHDSIVWDISKIFWEVTTKLAYNDVVEDWIQEAPTWWEMYMWKIHIPLKIKCFSWLND